MSKGYFTTPLSEHLEETPEGFLIARDCVLGRTGWQTYKVSELPREAADALGVDMSNPNASIELYRPAEEVFAPQALASLNGKPVTDDHPNSEDGFVHPDNFTEFARGHVQNPHRGSAPLEDGEWPIVGDVHITAEPLLSKVRNKLKRELSLGYDYALRRVGDRIEQHDFVYNHQAVVGNARAGHEARIADAAATESPPAPLSQEEPALTLTTTTKEKRPVKNQFLHLLGLGLRAKAADADGDPEELAQAAMEIGKHAEPPAQSADKHTDDRKRAHDALDRIMDGKGTAADEETFAKWAKQEAAEPEHEAEDDLDTSELEETLGADTATCPSCSKPMADCMCADEAAEVEEEVAEPDGELEEEEVPLGGADRRVRAADTVSGARAVLKVLRPVVARTKDAAVKSAFNSALAAVSRSSKPSAGGYDSFGKTARARDKAPRAPADRGRAADAATDPVAKLQAAYDAARKGGK